jgi:hypothetical protein
MEGSNKQIVSGCYNCPFSTMYANGKFNDDEWICEATMDVRQGTIPLQAPQGCPLKKASILIELAR